MIYIFYRHRTLDKFLCIHAILQTYKEVELIDLSEVNMNEVLNSIKEHSNSKDEDVTLFMFDIHDHIRHEVDSIYKYDFISILKFLETTPLGVVYNFEYCREESTFERFFINQFTEWFLKSEMYKKQTSLINRIIKSVINPFKSITDVKLRAKIARFNLISYPYASNLLPILGNNKFMNDGFKTLLDISECRSDLNEYERYTILNSFKKDLHSNIEMLINNELSVRTIVKNFF